MTSIDSTKGTADRHGSPSGTSGSRGLQPAPPMIEFIAGHGTRNDFVVVVDPECALDMTEELVVALCDRRGCLGADGVIRVTRGKDLVRTGVLSELPEGVEPGEWFMDYRNSDGSTAEMCGNGVRVFAHVLVSRWLVERGAEGRRGSQVADAVVPVNPGDHVPGLHIVDGGIPAGESTGATRGTTPPGTGEFVPAAGEDEPVAQFGIGTRAGRKCVTVHWVDGSDAEVSVEMGAPLVLGVSTATFTGTPVGSEGAPGSSEADQRSREATEPAESDSATVGDGDGAAAGPQGRSACAAPHGSENAPTTRAEDAPLVAVNEASAEHLPLGQVPPLMVAGLAVDMGNPHLAAVIPGLTPAHLAALPIASRVSYDPMFFPQGVNVEVVTPLAQNPDTGEESIHMRVHERGVGETRSCGTGTVAAAVAALADAERATGTVRVHVPGGSVSVTVRDGGSVLRGPSKLVSSGRIDAGTVLAGR